MASPDAMKKDDTVQLVRSESSSSKPGRFKVLGMLVKAAKRFEGTSAPAPRAHDAAPGTAAEAARPPPRSLPQPHVRVWQAEGAAARKAGARRLEPRARALPGPMQCCPIPWSILHAAPLLDLTSPRRRRAQVHPVAVQPIDRTFSKSGAGSRSSSGRTESGKPSTPGQAHGHKGSLLFKPLAQVQS
jgi:hypothetical protein